MVRITNAQYEAAYEDIKQDSVSGNCIVLVASDVDAICACKIFQALLKSDIIQHKIVPVSGYRDLEKANEELIAKDTELRSIVMINCGGLIDVAQFFNISNDVIIYIIDSHRPLNLDNLLPENRNVRVFDDDDDNDRIQELITAHEALLYTDEDDTDNESSNTEEDENGRLQNTRPARRRRLSASGRAHGRDRRRTQNQLLSDYYSSGLYFANSTSGQVYVLATQLAQTNNELLWLAIIGVTAQYIFERIDTSKYMGYLQRFTDDVARFNYTSDDTSSQNLKEDTIQCLDEYRFLLFRHWSLYESMFHSSYVASKLSVWKDSGKQRLNQLFARMGIERKQCEQRFTHMDIELKKLLPKKIEDFAPLFGLTDICFPSFSRVYGWKNQLSASDAVYSLATLLETSPPVADRLGQNVNWNEDEDWDSLEYDKSDEPDGLASGRRRWWMRNFYTAYDALNSIEAMERGISLCMEVQKAVARQGMAIIENKLAKRLSNFRMVILRDGADLPIFQHPLTLSKLALYLTDNFREKAQKNLPFVIASLDEEHESYLVVASTGAPTFGEIRKNPFGLTFQKAAERTGARISFDSFETSVLQIHKSDMERFLLSLRTADM